MQAFATCTNNIASQHYYQKEPLTPTTTKAPVPFVVVFDKKKPPH